MRLLYETLSHFQANMSSKSVSEDWSQVAMLVFEKLSFRRQLQSSSQTSLRKTRMLILSTLATEKAGLTCFYAETTIKIIVHSP